MLTTSVVLLLLVSGHAAPPPPAPALRPLVLWAWERPEDLGYIDTRHVSVAYLAATLTLRPEGLDVSPRRQPLRVPEATVLTAVFRIETAGAKLDDALATDTADEIVRLALRSRAGAVQVDFDATVSERPFYVRLLTGLRERWGADRRLEITALASWCLFDDWLKDLPPGLVDGVVPMVFRMGTDDARVRQALADGEPLRGAACRESLGIAVDEPIPRVPRGVRVHVFNPKPWTKEALAALREEIDR